MKIILNAQDIDDYRRFLAVKQLPQYRICGRSAMFPDEYASRLGGTIEPVNRGEYSAPDWMFDYQRAITEIAIRKRKYCLFIDCGFGKTAIFLEYARHAADAMPEDRRILIVSPLMVIPQTIVESQRFFGDAMQIEHVHAAGLQSWLHGNGERIGITNYEAIRPELERGKLGALILDESSMLKSHYGKWGVKLLEMGRGLDWKLASTGTPAPNDRIEYANHAVFMDAYPTVNSFLARFFVNRGQTNERWVLKPHALEPFYRALSHWCIFVTNPATYGWTDNTTSIPPIHTHEHEIGLTDEQKQLAYSGKGMLFASNPGGITNRSVLAQIAKGNYRGKPIASHKPSAIRSLIESWPGESTIVWCKYNAEQERLAAEMPDAGSVTGATSDEERQEIVGRFKAGELRVLITKPKILGFGLNLQIATRQVFSAIEDSYESYYQAVKRSNRVGSTRPLNVHLPITEIERPLMENVLRKRDMVQRDTEEQERIFRKEWSA